MEGGVKIYGPGEKHPYEGLSYAERQLRERQERARKLAEHKVRQDAWRKGEDPQAAVEAHRAKLAEKAEAAAPAKEAEQKERKPSPRDENKMQGPTVEDENKAAEAPSTGQEG